MMRRHNYVSAERYILSREFFGMKLGLENIAGFLADIGAPQTKYPTIHISGTNGKGSTAAMIDSILRAAGLKCGLFTSPHLVSLRERIRVNGQFIPKKSVTGFIDRHRTALSRRKLSFFELMTAMAFEHFDRSRVEVAVIETGLGGRLDASNVLQPVITITTEISRDHVDILGGSMRQIAFEKAGIIKSDTPHLIGMLPREAERVFKERCRQMGAPLIKTGSREYAIDTDRMRLDMKANGLSVKNQQIGLYGAHQLNNAALAIKAVTILKERGWRITKSAVSAGLKSVNWPGRFQITKKAGFPFVILDVSHNSSGARTLAQTFMARFPGAKARIITGFVKRKEHQQIFDHLAKIARDYHIVPLASRRTVDLDELLTSINFRHVPVLRYPNLRSAYGRVLKESRSDDIILIVGSHYLVGEFMEKYQSQ